MKELLTEIFTSQKVLTLEDLKIILQTNSRMTVFRRLKQLPYISSYSHCGKYYTLSTLGQFNKNGIWQVNKIYFSKHGTLKSTVLENIDKSSTGLTCAELTEHLHVSVHNTVLSLFRAHEVDRKQMGNQYVYLSIENGERQFVLRKQEMETKHRTIKDDADEHLALFMSLLNEKQRRLFAGYESLRLGYGGDKIIATKTGLNIKTVSQGRRELLIKDIDMGRIRKVGAGRHSIKKTKR